MTSAVTYFVYLEQQLLSSCLPLLEHIDAVKFQGTTCNANPISVCSDSAQGAQFVAGLSSCLPSSSCETTADVAAC
jgi:hypothetical protein